MHQKTFRKQPAHARHRIAHRHRMPSVAVITGTNSGEFMPLCFTFAVLILNRHFHRHFYGNGATVGKEDLHTSTQLFMYFEAFAKKPIQLRTLSDGKIGRFCNAKSLAISCTYKKFALNHIGLLEVIQYCTLL